jgi:hypothetical protein
MSQRVRAQEPAALGVIVAGYYTTQRQPEPLLRDFPLPFSGLQLISGMHFEPGVPDFPGAVFGSAHERRGGVAADQDEQAPKEQKDVFGRFQCSDEFAA